MDDRSKESWTAVESDDQKGSYKQKIGALIRLFWTITMYPLSTDEAQHMETQMNCLNDWREDRRCVRKRW